MGRRRGRAVSSRQVHVDHAEPTVAARGIKGNGLGFQLNALLADTLAASEALQRRGLRHVEELQLRQRQH
jgi:hypothetical protein